MALEIKSAPVSKGQTAGGICEKWATERRDEKDAHPKMRNGMAFPANNGNPFNSEMTVEEFNQLENTVLLQEIVKRFERGIPFSYQDERSDVFGKHFFISANPDGSEYLMRMDIENNEEKMVTIEKVMSERQGQYYLRLYGGN